MERSLAAAVVACLILVPRPAAAQGEVEAPPPTSLEIDLGYVMTSGNTDLRTITAREELKHRTGGWRFTQALGAVHGEADDVESAARYTALLRGERDLGARVGLYLLTQWRREPYSGIASQFEEGVGIVLHVLAPNPHELDFEGGVGLQQRRRTSDEEDEFGTARLATRYRYHFAEKAHAGAEAEYVMNLDDTGDGTLHGVLALVAPLTGGVSLRGGYDVYHRTEPPAGFDRTDTTLDAGLQFRF